MVMNSGNSDDDNDDKRCSSEGMIKSVVMTDTWKEREREREREKVVFVFP